MGEDGLTGLRTNPYDAGWKNQSRANSASEAKQLHKYEIVNSFQYLILAPP